MAEGAMQVPLYLSYSMRGANGLHCGRTFFNLFDGATLTVLREEIYYVRLGIVGEWFADKPKVNLRNNTEAEYSVNALRKRKGRQ